jgi:hypothetical protein
MGPSKLDMSEVPDAPRIPHPSLRAAPSVPQPSSPGRRAGSGRNGDPPIRPSQGGNPATVFVAGDSRPLVNSVAFAFAEMIDLTPFWLEVRDPKGAAEGPDPGNTGWVPPDRMFVSEGGRGFEPAAGDTPPDLWTIVRADEPATVLSHLTDFLRLPEVIQEILSATASVDGPRAVVVAGSDRVAHLFPRTAEGLQRFLGSMAVTSLNIVAAHTGPTGPGRFGFATVFRVAAESPQNWLKGTIVCEQGIAQGPFAVGRTNRLSDVPAIARVLSNMFPLKR